MYVRQVRKVKINLLLLIFITIFIIALVFTAIHFINSSNANTNESPSEYTSVSKSQNSKTSLNNLNIGKDTFSNFNSIDEKFNSNSNQEFTPTTTEPKAINFNNHSYIFDKDDQVELLNNNTKQFLQLNHQGYIYRINTDKTSFSDIKKQGNLVTTLNQKYKINITSEVKTGNYNGLDLILCTISENDAMGYFIITPLNEKEIIFIEIYNSVDTSTLISDLTDPLNDINTKIKTSIQNN